MEDNNLKTLYNSLKRDNYDVPDNYDSFERTLTNDKHARRTLYNSLKRDNYDVPDSYESFDRTLFPAEEQAAAPSADAAPAAATGPASPAPSAAVQQAAASGEGTILGDAKLGGAAGGVLGDSVGKASVSGGALGVAGVGGGYEWSYAPSPGASGASPSTWTREASVRPAPAKFTPEEEASLVEEVGRLNTSSEGVDVIPDGRGGFVQKVTSGDKVYYRYPKGDVAEYKLENGVERMVRYRFADGEVREYNANGDGGFKTIHAPHVPHIGDEGHILYQKHDQPFELDRDLISVWNSKIFNNKDNYRDYHSDYAGKSESELRQAISGLVASKSGASEEQLIELANRYDAACLELVARQCGFGSLSEARSHPGKFEWSRFASRVAEKYPSDYTGVMLDASMYHVAADHPGDILFDAAKSESESLWGDMIEGSAPHHTYADIINNLLYFEKDRNNFVTLCMIKARETDRHVDDIIKEELERVVTNISAAAEKGVDIAVEQYKSSLPGWKLPFYTAFGHSTFGQLGVWLGKKAGTWTDEEERLMEGASQKYVKELGGWERFFVRDVGGFVGSLPEILLASWGAEALMPAASAATAGGRILHSTLTMTGVGILSQGASDLNAGQFSGWGQWVGNVAHSAAMGATMGVFGEAARGVMLRPTSKMAVLWNKGAEYVFETAGFTLPEWVSTVYSGVTPEGEPITGDYFWHSAVHNLGVVIAMKGRRNFKNWKPVVNKTDLAQLQAAYPDLYNDVTHNLDMVTRGKGADELSDSAKRQLAQLQDDMSTPGKGVSWDTYKKTMNLFGYEVIPPKPSSVRRDGNVVQVLDSGGNVITEKRYINSKEAKTAEGTLHSQIEHDKERTNAQRYDAARTRKLYYDACAEVADLITAGETNFAAAVGEKTLNRGDLDWRKRDENGNFVIDENGNYVADENYRCVTPEDVDAALKDAYDTPDSERSSQQQGLIAFCEQTARRINDSVPTVRGLTQMVCDIYGIKVEQLERVSNLEPSERRKGDKATQAMVLFNDLLNRGVTSGEPVGRVKLRDGETYIDVLNEANPANKDGYYFYKDANGNTQWLSATEVESYEPITSEREQRYGVSRSNSEAKVQGAYDSYVGVAKMYSDEALRQRIDWLLDKYDLKLDDEGNVLRKRGSRRGEAGYDERGMRSDDADLLKIQAFLKVLTDRAANRPKPYATEVERAERVRQWGERNGVTYDTEYLLEHPLELDELVKEMESGEVTAPDADVRQSPTMPANTATPPTPLTDDAALAPTSVEVGDRYEVADRDGVHDIEVVGDYGGAYGDGFLEVRIDGAEETVPLRREDLEKLLGINSGEAGVQSGEDEVALTTPQTEPMAQTETRPEPETGTPALTGDGGAAAQGTEPMPLQADGNPDFAATTPDRGRQYIYDKSGLDKSEADAYVGANLAAAEKDLDNIKNKPPKMGTNLVKYKNEKTDWESRMRGAQAAVDYWKQVKAIEQAREAEAAAERKAKDAEVIAQAQAEEQARQAAEVAKQQEQDERGAGAVHPAIAEKWNNAPKIEGYKDEVVLANGERVPGTYYLVESGAVTPSHNASREFEKYEGFPVDENGNTINDRDYERDKDAQNITRSIADKYDSRALQTPVIVSKDGVVLSGNGRTMAGELAASNNTDGAYIEHLKNYGHKYGFSPEQVSSMQHPRAVFVPDADMPYTTDTFAKFNEQEMKGQSKTEQAVKLGKVVDDATFNRIVREVAKHASLSEFFGNDADATGAINELRRAGAINDMQYASMFDGDKLSKTGREIVENMLLGKIFSSDPDVVRTLSEHGDMRQRVIAALVELGDNVLLGKDYSLEAEIINAIKMVHKARLNGAKQGELLSNSHVQGAFSFAIENGKAEDYSKASSYVLGNVLNGANTNDLKRAIALYNESAASHAHGELGLDLFGGGAAGIHLTKENILTDVIKILENGNKKERDKAVDAAIAGRKERAGTGADEAGPATGSSAGSAGAERSGRSEKETPTLTHDEAISLIAQMEERANVAPEMELTIENWDAQFGDDGRVVTPIGEVKMGENQFTKLMRQGREGKLGMIKPTLESPDVIIEDASVAKEDDVAERKSSYVFVKAFKKADGSRYYYFTSVTVSKDGKEVVISNQEKRKNAIANLLTKGKLVWKHADDVSAASDVEQGLYSSQGKASDPTTEGTDAPQTNDVSKGEVFTRPALKPETNTDFSGVDSGLLSGVTAPAGNSPQTSVGKVSAKDSDLQAKVEKNVENERKSNIQGLESYSEDELRVIVEEHVRSAIADADMDAEITGIRFIGSRTTGTARADSDLDVLVEYQGTAREDSLFNVLNDEDNRLVIDGITVDINPITPGKSGTIEEFMRRNAGYKKETTVQEQIALAEQQTETSPSEAQKEAGNYKKGHVKIDGFDISIEQPKGSVRSGVDDSGKPWSQTMNNTYGYIRGTEGVDGDHIDVFLSDDPSQGDVFVVDQVNNDGSFDEHKVMYGFPDIESARKAYLSNYEDGWQGLGAITAVSKDEFKKWIGSSHRKTKPFAEYKNVKVKGEQAAALRQPTGQTVEGDIARFHKETDSSGRTAIDEANYNADDLVAPLLVDGKKSHIGITLIVPDDINEPTYTRAYYDYAHLIDPKTNKGWQAVGDKIDEWNASHKKDEQGFDDGDAPQVRFPSVDAALKFAEWFEGEDGHTPPAPLYLRGGAEAGGVLPSAEEVALRDGLVDVLRGAGIDVVADEAEGQRVLDAANGHVQAMGSRVNKRMAEIDALLKGREMNKSQQAVVDVFSGKKDNVPIDIERTDGNRRVIMRQGNEQGAGTKHSVFGHYGTTRGVISADDILLVPEVLIKGERTEKQRGKSTIVEYRHTDENGTRFTVLTESKDKGEVFNDFYSNKKASNQIPQRPNGDTPESARSNDSDANLLAKIQKVADKASVEEEKTGADGEVSTHSDATQANPTFSREDLGAVLSDAKIQQIVDTSKDLPENSQYFRTGSGEVYGFVRDGKIYIDPRVASAETPVHEYCHLWADALKRANPEAWKLLKEAMLGEKDVLEHVKRLYPELEGDDLLGEVFSHYSGKRGAERLRVDMEREVKNAEGVFAKARVAVVFDKIRRALSRFWEMARDLFAGKNSMLNGMSAEDFADMAMNDMLSGFDPRGVEKDRGEAAVANEDEVLYEPMARNTGRDIALDDRVSQREYLLSDNYVARLTGNEFAKSDTPLTERVAQFYTEKYGGKVEREGFGMVHLDKRGVKDSLSHGLGRNKAAAFAAVPSIIKEGALIDHREYYKGRNQDSYTIAAPVEIGDKGYVGVVVVTRGKETERNRFYLHEVILQENLQEESIKTDTKADSHQGDVAKVIKEIVSAKENSGNVAKEHGSSYRSGSGEVIRFEGHGEQLSLFGGTRNEERGTKAALTTQRTERVRRAREMSDAELLKEMGRDIDELDKAGRGDWGVQTLCSQEYDERHIKEYNAECDAVRKMLEENNVDVEQAEQMLLDSIYTWREGYATADRTKLLAQFDTINDYYGELEERGLRNEESETDARNTETSPTLDERAAAEQSPTMPATTETSPTPKRGGGFDPSAIKLRKLKAGETCHVERRYVESGGFDFTGSERVESDADLAYIFRNLETSAIENSFLVLIKNGKATILHIGMGGYSMTPGHIGAGILAASQLKPDAVIFVHNHPSGSLRPSQQDVAMQEKCKKMFGADKVREAIIIDITSGKYSTYDLSSYDAREKERPRSVENEVPYKTLSFSKQVFDKDYVPEATFQITDANKAAEFISAHRLGERDKLSLIVLNRQKRVTGNIFLPWTTLDGVDINKAADAIAKFIHQMGGESGILYGSGSISRSTLAPLARAIRDRDVYLDDFINVEGRSAQVEGVLEPETSYEAVPRNTGLANEDSVPYDDSGISDEELAGYDAGRYSFAEAATAAMMRLSQDHIENVDFKSKAIRLFSDNLNDLRKIMSKQRTYDRRTVDSLVRLTRSIMATGFFKDMSAYEVKRLLAAIKKGVGADDLTPIANNVVDILVKHQLRESKLLLSKLMKEKGRKVDARGVEVQAGLDIDGQRMMSALKDGMSLGENGLLTRINDCENRLVSEDEVIRKNAMSEYQGLMLAKEWHDNIRASVEEENGLPTSGTHSLTSLK